MNATDKEMMRFLRHVRDLKGMFQRGAFTYGTLRAAHNNALRVTCDLALELGWVKYGVNRGNYGRHAHEGETLIFITKTGRAECARLAKIDSAEFLERLTAAKSRIAAEVSP